MARRWAELRARELRAWAEGGEAVDPAQVHRIWSHVLCLDPDSEAAEAGRERTRPLRIHQPDVVRRVGVRRQNPPSDFESALVGVRQAIVVVRAAAAPPPAPEPSPADVSALVGLLDRGEELLRTARFEQALETARSADSQLEAADADPGTRVRALVLAATAQIALGRNADATETFNRALAMNPAMELDPMRTSPKVMRVFRSARAQGGL